jgi:hypothetical protein
LTQTDFRLSEADGIVALDLRQCRRPPIGYESIVEREAPMALESITTEQVEQIATLAKAVRRAQDDSLAELTERNLREPKPARGEHNPVAAVGVEPLPAAHPARVNLINAIAALSDAAHAELLALFWIGRGQYGAKDWPRVVAYATAMPGISSKEFLAEQPDLYERLIKGLYELDLR